ncbi:MAG TPA: hypothetical protein VL326_19120 [Kofleriaceae bacterium]|nr:hypothetical protein [Kofleriaceae bacterium]
MTRLYRLVLSLTLGACAMGGPGPRRGSPDANGDDDETPDSRTTSMPDAPPSSSCAQAFTGVLATWTLTGQAGNQASTPVTSKANGITAGALARSAGLTATAGTNSINSSGWPTTSTADTTKYYTFTITPPSGCSLALSSAAIDVAHSSTGPALGAIATSADNYQQQLSISTSTATAPSLVVSGGTTQLEIRVYGYMASSASGTMRLQNTLSLTGSLH